MAISFIGLGAMGKGMALNLARCGVPLTVYDIVTDSFPAFAERGVETTTDITQAAKAEYIFLSLPNSRIVESVCCDPDGLFPCLQKGQVIVDLSTITYTATIRIADRLKEKGVSFLDAPVSGMKARADNGTLTVMCGGDEAVYEAVYPYFKYIGTKIYYMGKSGNGQLSKLINQLLFDINAAALAEILPLSALFGLDCEKIGEIINSGTGRSYASEFFVPRDLEGIYNEGYAMESAYKDLISASEISMARHIPLPVLNSAIMTYQLALLKGLNRESKGAMIKVYEDILGVKYRKAEAAEE